MRTFRSFLAHRQNLLGLAIVMLFIIVAAAAPTISPSDTPGEPSPVKIVGKRVDMNPHPPDERAPLGTLPGQVDVFHSLIWGSRSALLFGLTVTLVTAVFGILIGAASGYFGGWANEVIMRITDAMLAFPLIAGVVLIRQVQMVASRTLTFQAFWQVSFSWFEDSFLPALSSVDPLLLAFILFSWMPYARLMNTVVQQVKGVEFITAARALGAGHTGIIVRHLIPNTITPAVVLAARDVGGIVLLQATFTFIGMGGDSVWGNLLVSGRDWVIGPGGNLLTYWWTYLPATLGLVLFGIGWNLLGDGLNDWLSPYQN